MAWRGLHVTKPSRLALADGQVTIAQDDGDVRVPLEDLAWIVLDTPQSTLTGSLLSACMSAGIALIATDETHTPSGVLLPFHRHFRQGEIAHRQAAIGAPLKKRLWRRIVRAKIENQAEALHVAHRGGARTLREMAHLVGSGDPRNVEARAARYYWTQLWPEFRREDGGDKRNKLLNYGYAVVRAGVARSLVAAGLLPAFGLNHASVTNAFNLADDIVEPFRPFVDSLAWKTADAGRPSRDDLTIDDRRAMAGVLLAEAKMSDETVTLLVAAERTAESLVRAMEGSTADILELPAFASRA
ncbi:MAG: type II CRISPR-associated endonuclease Cas1 [Proteobacteria bacterium]|nr:type II CRISPR-associated endonuclease Cas1 [Pseudomonadota bacterium]MBI3499912.1 type II CRISPR-associated endonuclease Cas1 [Pseudomonadota bacterium]